MTRMLLGLALGAACLSVAAAREEKSARGDTDETFVLKASVGGLAEVTAGTIAAKKASDPAVKRFAQKMVDDHTRANKELIELAARARLKPATTLDAEHRKMVEALTKLSGAEFDREYMAGQVKDHKDTVALFEKEAKNGKDEGLKSWAGKTLPTLRDHLKMAQDIESKIKGGSEKGKDRAP